MQNSPSYPLLRSMCKFQRNMNSSMPEASDTASPSVDLLLDLLKNFLNLHQPTFSEATLSCIITEGGPKTFDFRGHVMFFGLQYPQRQPWNRVHYRFCGLSPDWCTLYLQLPHIKEALQAAEERYNSVAEFDKSNDGTFCRLN